MLYRERGRGVGEVLHREADVTDPAAVDQIVQATLSRWGRIDVLVNNAGYAPTPAQISETTNEAARRCFATNVLGPYYFLRRVLPGMVALPGGGVVIDVCVVGRNPTVAEDGRLLCEQVGPGIADPRGGEGAP